MDNFKIMAYSNYLYYYFCDNISNNISKKNNIYRNSLESNLIKLIENINYANVNDGNIKLKYQNECLVNISVIDFIIGILKKYNIISSKIFMLFISKLLEIKKMISKWISNGKV